MTTGEVRIVVAGSVPRKNRRKGYRVVAPKGKKPFITHYLSEEWKDWIARLSMEVGALDKIDRGAWSITIRLFVDRQRHLDGETLHVALGDVDSATSAVLDGLIAVGVLDDDARFTSESATKHYDKSSPRTEIILRRELGPVEQLDLDATIATAPARPKSPKRKRSAPTPEDF